MLIDVALRADGTGGGGNDFGQQRRVLPGVMAGLVPAIPLMHAKAVQPSFLVKPVRRLIEMAGATRAFTPVFDGLCAAMTTWSQRHDQREAHPITVEVVRNAIVAYADEMANALSKAAYNMMIYEVRDYCCGLLDAQGPHDLAEPRRPADLPRRSRCRRRGRPAALRRATASRPATSW